MNCTTCMIDDFKHELCPNEFCEKCGAEGTSEDVESILMKNAVSKWIPCSERMPEFSTEVLVTMEWGDRHVMSVEWDSQTNELAWEDTIQNFRWDFDNVIAWMPLPKPYEEVKENE